MRPTLRSAGCFLRCMGFRQSSYIHPQIHRPLPGTQLSVQSSVLNSSYCHLVPYAVAVDKLTERSGWRAGNCNSVNQGSLTVTGVPNGLRSESAVCHDMRHRRGITRHNHFILQTRTTSAPIVYRQHINPSPIPRQTDPQI